MTSFQLINADQMTWVSRVWGLGNIYRGSKLRALAMGSLDAPQQSLGIGN
jgi:hypothetical protein